MALIPAKTILTSLCFLHITLAFFFFTNPATIADQGLVFIIGDAMGMPESRAFETQSPALAFLGALLCFLGISDLLTLSLPDEIGLLHHWSAQAPLRLALSMATLFYTFAASSASPLYQNPFAGGARLAHPSAHAHVPGYQPSTWGGDMLKNRVFFTFAFVEMVSWFWVWVTLKEEVREIAARKQAGRRGSQGGGYRGGM